MAAATCPVNAPDASAHTSCAPTSIPPSLSIRTASARYTYGGKTITSTRQSGLIRSSRSASRASLTERDPCIFQLPATTGRRIVTAYGAPNVPFLERRRRLAAWTGNCKSRRRRAWIDCAGLDCAGLDSHGLDRGGDALGARLDHLGLVPLDH